MRLRLSISLIPWLAMLLVGVVAAQSTDPLPDAASPDLPTLAGEILAGWADGRDMAAQVARYADLRSAQPTRRPAVPRERAATELAASLENLRDAAESVVKIAADPAATNGTAATGIGVSAADVQSAYAAFKIQDLLARDDLESTAARLAILEVDVEILNRFETAQQVYLEASDSLHGAFSAPAEDEGGVQSEEAALITAATRVAVVLKAVPGAITALRSSLLPYRRQGLPPRDPVLEPTIVPSYLDASGAGSAPGDLASTPEAPLSEEVLLKAEELGYDYVRIFEFVRNEIETEWYAGSQKGALGALRQGSGNDVDQASLLVALFRASSLPARYVRGVIELPLEVFAEQLGLADANRVADFLARAGVARAPVIRGGVVTAFHVEHTWVSAYLPYTNYRGAVVDFSGKTWLPLAPSIQGTQRTAASGVLDAMGFSSESFLAGYLSTPQSSDPLVALRADVELYLSENGGGSYEEQLAAGMPVAVRFGILPSSLPVAVVAVTAERVALSEAQRVNIRLVARSGSGVGAPVIFEHAMPLAEILGRRLTFSYLPATADDHQIVNAWGGLEQVPAYLVRLRPQLRIGGRREVVGQGSLPMAVPHRLEVELTGPFGSESTAQTFISGSYHALAIGAQRFVEHLVTGDPEDEEFLGARLLSGIAFGFGADWDAGERELSRLLDVAVARPLPAVAVASNAVQARAILGLPHRLEWQGVTLDAALRVAEPVARGEADAARDWMRLSALHGSSLEHRIFERQFLVDSLSADKALGLARAQGVEVHTLDAGNIATLLPTLQHPQAVRSAVEDWVGQGMVVEIPVLPVAVNAWVGSAWRVEDPASGAGGYFLAGALAGGATTEEPQSWILDFVADALAHLRSEPNEDSLAGVEVLKIPGGDFQIGTVGEAFPFELTVRVLDTIGRPVLGAEVTFRSLAGNGRMGSSGGTTATIETDAGGFASVELVAGTRVLDNLVQVRRHPDDEKDTWALRHLVTATVEADIGQLSIDRPFEAIGYPGSAVSMLRTDTSETIFDDEIISFWSDTMHIEVTDRFGNGVSNAEVEATALDPILGQVPFEICTDDGAGASGVLFFDALPEDDGSFRGCASNFPTREECGEQPFRIKTEPRGKAFVGVIMGDSVVAIYPARVELRQVDLGIAIDEPEDPVKIPPAPEAPDDPPPDPVMVSYDVEVTNRGTHDAEDVRVEVVLSFPDEVEIESVETDRGGWVAPDWTLGALGVGARATLTVNLLVPHTTPRGPDVLSVLAQASAPGDPLVNVGDDRAFETTGVEVDEDAGFIGSGAASAAVGVEVAKALVEIDPLEFEYSIRFIAEPFGLPPRCYPFRGRLVRTRGFVVHAATRIAEPYPLPIEFIHLTSDPADCATAEFHTCASGDAGIACRDACISGVDCAYCVEGGSGCEFVALVRDCAEDLWTFRRSEIVIEDSEFTITNDGFAGAAGQAPDGVSAQAIMTAGPEPGLHDVGFEGSAISRELKPNQETGELEVQRETFPPWTDRTSPQEIILERIGSFHGIEPEILNLDPELVELTEGGVTSSETTFEYRIQPPDYDANLVVVDIEADGDFVIDLLGTETSGEGDGVLPEGSRLDANKEHQARLLVNPGSAVEVASDPVDVPLDGQIIRRVDDPYVLSQDTDLAIEAFCSEGTELEFHLNRAADVTLWFQRVDDVSAGVSVEDEKIFIFEDERLEEGEQSYLMTLEDLAPGDYRGTLRAVDDQGQEQEEEFMALAEHGVTDHRRVGQSTLKGVNLWKGSLSLSREDLLIPGRGVPLAFSRSYASGASKVPGFMGLGWSHNWESRVMVTPCEEVVVTGGEGSGMRFLDDGSGGLEARPGSHGTLMADPNDLSFDFYSVGGNRYHYVPVEEKQWELEKITDPNGNITTLAYAGDGKDRLLKRVEDSSGRRLDFAHEERAFALGEAWVLTRVSGPDGIEMRFDYDTYGNLIEAQRERGARREIYRYRRFDDWDFKVRWGLEDAINASNGATTHYVYQVADIEPVPNQRVSSLLVKELTMPEGGVTRFTWDTDALKSRVEATHLVIDGRGQTSEYTFSNYGSPLSIVDPLSHTTTMEWDDQNLVMTRQTDRNGVATDFTYDDFGNPLTETVAVIDFDGTEHTYTSINTYVPFDGPPFIRNLLASRTDRNGHTTAMTYDARGNWLSRSTEVADFRGASSTVAMHHTYAGNGDRLTTTDARGGVTSYVYDSYGYVEQVTDPVGNVTQAAWDVRGRQTSMTDALGRITSVTYDDLARVTQRLHPDEGVERVDYFDGLNLRVEIDPLNGATRTTTDREGRVVLIENAGGGQKVFEYDAEGNKTLESRWFDSVTPRDDVRFEYDPAGRLAVRRETLGKLTTFGFDAVGNLTSERLVSEVEGDDFQPRLTLMTYDALDRPIEVARQLGDGFVTVRRKFDGEGNRLIELDPLDRVTSSEYDALNRLIRVNDSGARERRMLYDGNGNLVRSEVDNVAGELPAIQVRERVFDAADRLVAEIDALGNVSGREYDAVGSMVREIDRNGNVSHHIYDTRKRRTHTTVHLDRVTDPARDVVTEFRYDLNGNRIGETLPNGNLLTHAYDELNRLTSTVDSLGPIVAITYDARANPLRETDARGNVTINAYDVYDRLIQQDLPEDRTMLFTYDVAGNRTSETNARGFATTLRYDSLNRVVEMTDALERSTIIEFDAAGNKIRETDRRGKVKDFEYDLLNRLVLEISPEIDGERYTREYGYDQAGNKISEVDRRGILTEFLYDHENRLTHTTRAGILVEQLEYDPEGNVVSSFDANGNQTFFDFDERDLLLAERRPLAATTRFEHDDMGDRLRVIDPEDREAVRTYDDRRRMLSVTRGGSVPETTSYSYDGNGNLTSLERPEGGEWFYEYDDANRLTAVVNAESERTEYTYDPNGNLETQTDAELNVTSFEYDEIDRQTGMTYPDLTVETTTYDAAGNVIEVRDAKGQIADVTYDALNRETLREYRETEAAPDIAQAVASTWDPNNNLLTTVESARGDSAQTSTRAYDAFDRLESTTDRWGHQLRYIYDANGNRTRLTDPEGAITSYTFDALNRVSNVGIPSAGATQYTYFKNNLLRTISYPNGTTAEYTYDDSNRVATLDNRHNSAALVSRFEYTYDLNGNRVQQIETHSGQPPETTDHGFDAADRLLSASYTDKVTSYTYDAVGNRLTETDTDLSGDTVLSDKSFTYNSRNQLEELTDLLDPAGSETYSYDANGNRTSRASGGGVTDLTFDIRDRLTTVEQDGTTVGNYRYNSQGLRISKQSPGSGLQRYVYDDESVLLRTADTGRATKYDYGPGQLLSVDDSEDGRAYYLFDALGSVSELTTPAGGILGRYVWDAWGNKRASVETEANDFGFTGHEHDDETGLIYAQARFYDPVTGVWLSQDPADADPAVPPSLHRYLYVYQNPTLFVDPDGRNPAIDRRADAALKLQQESPELVEAAAVGAGNTVVDLGELFVKGVLGTLDFASLGGFSASAVSIREFFETEGTLVEKGNAASDAFTERQLEVVTLGFSSAPDKKQHAKELTGVASIERGGQAIGTGIGEGDPEKVLLGVAEVAGGTSQMSSLVAGAAETTIIMRGRVGPRLTRESADGPAVDVDGPEWNPQEFADALDSLAPQLERLPPAPAPAPPSGKLPSVRKENYPTRIRKGTERRLEEAAKDADGNIRCQGPNCGNKVLEPKEGTPEHIPELVETHNNQGFNTDQPTRNDLYNDTAKEWWCIDCQRIEGGQTPLRYRRDTGPDYKPRPKRKKKDT